MKDEQPKWRHVTNADQLATRRLFSHLPDSFQEKNEALLELRTLFHAEMAAALEPHLRAHLRAQPQETVFDRLKLRISLGLLLDSLGLTLQCPETGYAVSMELQADEQRRDRLSRMAKGESIPLESELPPGTQYVLGYEDPLNPKNIVLTHRSDALPEIIVRAELESQKKSPIEWAKDTRSSSLDR